MWKVSGKKLVVENDQSVDFSYEIKECSLIEDVLVVILDLSPGVRMTENVFGVSQDGHILWQIERIPETASDPVNRYTDIISGSGHQVRLWNWNCVGVDVDIRTGRVVSCYFGK